MADAVTGFISCNVNLTSVRDATHSAGSASEAFNVGSAIIQIASGTGINQCNQVWGKTATLAATTVTYDLTALTGSAGETKAFSKVKLLCIFNNDTVAGHDLVCFDAAATAWQAPLDDATATVTVPGGCSAGGTPLLLANMTAAGWTVDGSHKSLKLNSGANSVSYTILIAGLA